MIPAGSSLPCSPPSIQAPLTFHCFKSFRQKSEAPAMPTFCPAAPRRNPSAAQRMQPAPRTRRSSRARATGGGHEQCSPRPRRREPYSSSLKKKKREREKNQCSRRPLPVAAVKGGQKVQPPPIRGLEFHFIAVCPFSRIILCSNERI